MDLYKEQSRGVKPWAVQFCSSAQKPYIYRNTGLRGNRKCYLKQNNRTLKEANPSTMCLLLHFVTQTNT